MILLFEELKLIPMNIKKLTTNCCCVPEKKVKNQNFDT